MRRKKVIILVEEIQVNSKSPVISIKPKYAHSSWTAHDRKMNIKPKIYHIMRNYL